MIKVFRFPTGELEANCFVAIDEASGDAFVVDPGAPSPSADRLLESLREGQLRYILLTHGHFDHIGNAAALKRKHHGAEIVISKKDAAFTNNDRLNLCFVFGLTLEHFSADRTVDDGDILPFGSDGIEVLSTPGHTAGSVCYLTEDCIFTGDTIMKMTTGRTDFPTGSGLEMMKSAERLAELEGDFRMFCGHGDNTTLEYEREHNYAMRNGSYDDLY